MQLHFTVTEKVLDLPVFVTSVGHTQQPSMDRPSGHPDFHWLHTVKGEGTVELAGEKRRIGHSSGFLMYPGVPHRYWPHGSWETMWLTFNGAHLTRFMSSWGLKTEVMNLGNVATLSFLIEDMLAQPEEPALHSVMLSSLGYRFISELLRQSALKPAAQRRREQLEPLLKFMEENYRRPLTLPELAEQIDVTPQHLCRLFQTTLDTTPLNYIQALRLAEAKSLLATRPDMKIADIAQRIGFENHSYFCLVFKNNERMTPSEFRRIYSGMHADRSASHTD